MNSSNTGSRDPGDAVTEALPAPVPPMGYDEMPEPFPDDSMLPPPDDEPFVPRKRYTPGRSTKVLACVLLVVAGFFGGSVVQKQIDLGNRAGRNVGNFQGTNLRTGNGGGGSNGTGNQGTGQGRRGAGGNTTAPSSGAGQ
ncbi:hypothetical protein [Arthrobacter sp. fls2-241-R2A-200]|uniref:hypothetical protein n=1 Tax=unclassified Arthrobacter TaxID=235627 RepID=UPI00254B8533|nr:hypothetical protein [Arthrobacter sp. fls2-241-R2A-200]